MMDRELTDNEKTLVREMLKYASGEYSSLVRQWDITDPSEGRTPIDVSAYMAQLDNLRVVKKCNCGEEGCDSVYFQQWQMNTDTVALVDAILRDDERICVLHVDLTTNQLFELEVI